MDALDTQEWQQVAKGAQERFTGLEMMGSFLRTLDVALSLLCRLCRPRDQEEGHGMTLGVSVPGRAFPCTLPGAWLGEPVVSAGEPSLWQAQPRVLRIGLQTFRKSLDKNQWAPASVLHFLFFSLIEKPCSWIFFGSSFLLKMCIGTLGGGPGGAWTRSLA